MSKLTPESQIASKASKYPYLIEKNKGELSALS